MTILEIAKELNVSKTAIRKHITAEFREQYMKNVDGTFQISANGCELLRESFQKRIGNDSENFQKQAKTDSTNLLQTDAFAEMLAVLKNQLEAKDAQIAELNARLSETAAALAKTAESLQAEQALHAGTMQKQLEQQKKGPLKRWLEKRKRVHDDE